MKKLLLILLLFPLLSFAQQFISNKQLVIIGYSTESKKITQKRVIQINNYSISVELPDNSKYTGDIVQKRKYKKEGQEVSEFKTKDGCIIYIYTDNLFLDFEKFNNSFITYYLDNYIEPSPEEKKKAEEVAEYNANTLLYGKFSADCIKEKKIKIGMKGTAVITILGIPEAINRTETKSVIGEQLVYENTFVYLENGIVTAIQQHLSK